MNNLPPAPPPNPVSKETVSEVLARSSALRRSHQAMLDRIRRTLAQLRRRAAAPSGDRSPAGESSAPQRLRREFHLTAREQEVAMLLSDGLSNAQVAETLGVSTHTARHHTESVLLKLGVHSRAAAGAVVRRYVLP